MPKIKGSVWLIFQYSIVIFYDEGKLKNDLYTVCVQRYNCQKSKKLLDKLIFVETWNNKSKNNSTE